VHNWDRQGRAAPNLSATLAGDGITQGDLEQAADRNVEFHQAVDIERRLLEKGVSVEHVVIPDDIHDFLRWQSWRIVTTATGAFFARHFISRR
jgi:hypothetical protein